MKYAIIALTLPLLLTACGEVRSSVSPDVVAYRKEIQSKAADEMESGLCPILTDVMMPDYKVARDQARIK